MYFDFQKRKLITIDQDGKLKIWNFDSGQKLNKIAVSQDSQDRLISSHNSNNILAVDVKGTERKCLKQSLLKDVCFMELHNKNLLTVYSEGGCSYLG